MDPTLIKRWALGLVVVCVILAVTVVIIAQPDVPDMPEFDDSKIINRVLIKSCLRTIAKHHDPEYFRYVGHVKVWFYHWASTIGFGIDQKQRDYWSGYYNLEKAVNLYRVASGDSMLNMALSPTEFEVTYRLISKDYGLKSDL